MRMQSKDTQERRRLQVTQCMQDATPPFHRFQEGSSRFDSLAFSAEAISRSRE